MKKPFHAEAKVSTFENARELKKNLTPAEAILWDALRARKLNGLKFRRQHPVLTFVLDFYCHERRLCIELDGGIHMLRESKLSDDARTAILQSMNISVKRFTNEQVISDLKSVLTEIQKLL